jgi:hypothetical protein
MRMRNIWHKVAALTDAMVPFTGADGVVTIHNVFRYVVAQRQP